MNALPFQDGLCGNFNGHAADDDRLAVLARVGYGGVPARELLFAGNPIFLDISRDLNRCPTATMNAAIAVCAQKGGLPSTSCLVAYCFAPSQGSKGRKLQGNFQFV